MAKVLEVDKVVITRYKERQANANIKLDIKSQRTALSNERTDEFKIGIADLMTEFGNIDRSIEIYFQSDVGENLLHKRTCRRGSHRHQSGCRQRSNGCVGSRRIIKLNFCNRLSGPAIDRYIETGSH